MSKGNVLITGGAGFIGSHLTDHLLDLGFEVTVFDNLSPQVHAHASQNTDGWPTYLNKDCRRIKGDVLDIDAVRKVLKNQDFLIHLAASVGVGQSMTNILDYTRNNEVGGATVLQVLSEERHNIKKIAVASSMSIYGEGAYKKSSTGKTVYPHSRDQKQLGRKNWELNDENGEILEPIPTPETKPLFPQSIYAVNKMVHEYDFIIMGKALGISTSAMRLFNVFGTRQALSNPYTGVAAIFISRLKNNQSPIVFEDGKQSRNFVHVSDIVRGFSAFLLSEKVNSDVYNFGSDEVVTIFSLANMLAELMGKDIRPKISQEYRQGDIRHCYPDLGKVKSELGWEPKVTLQEGLPELIEWASDQIASDYSEQSHEALRMKGLLK